MRPSPIQLQEMLYLGIKVWPNSLEEWEKQNILEFDFDGVEIKEHVDKQILDDEKDPTAYAIQLRIAIENKGGKNVPYDLDVSVYGCFTINSEIEKEKRENMVVANGLAILYSAIRDQVMTLTSRCAHGKLILPTVNFLDKVKEQPKTLVKRKNLKKNVKEPS